MLFHTQVFLIFLALLLLCLACVRRHGPRKMVLLVASYTFYMWWNPAFISLILFSTVVNYWVGLQLGRADSRVRRRLLLAIGVGANLGVLGFFKYANFLQDNLLLVLRCFGYEPGWASLNIILPVGISFYTFQSMSYTIDVYRRQLPVCRSLLDLALYISFFPQLVAGPIIRAGDFLPQLDTPNRVQFDGAALMLVLRGLAKKVIIADSIAVFSDRVFADVTAWSSLIIWVSALCFYVQIYCDFSGYSDMAIGIGRILGFELPINFRRPYFSRSPTEFWRRWHISLSTWLRDYLYISLGGNRHGALKTFRNLMITMLLGGLWHGASWNFVLWGSLHGLALVVHRLYRDVVERQGWATRLDASRAYSLVSFLLLQYWVVLTWIPFRVTSTAEMLYAVRKFVVFDFDFGLANIGLGSMSFFSTVLLLVAFWLLHLASNFLGGLDEKLARAPMALSGISCVAIGFVLFVLWPLQQTPFIYFEF